jgi:hypothetical protein
MKCLMELDKGYGLNWPEKLAYLAFKFMAGAQTRCPVTHSFEPGVYVREMFIPKGTVFIGRAHRHGHRVDLVSGKVLLMEENRKIHLEAPFEMSTVPCYMTAFIAMTDVVGRTYHPNPTESRDLVALEDDAFRPASEPLAIGAAVNARILAIEAERAKVLEAA